MIQSKRETVVGGRGSKGMGLFKWIVERASTDIVGRVASSYTDLFYTTIIVCCLFTVSLSNGVDSLSPVIVHRSTSDYHVCADDWQEELSQLACRQMGLG